MIAVKFWSQSTSNPSGFPDYWPWKKKIIPEDNLAEYVLDGWTLYSATTFRQYIESVQPDFERWELSKRAAQNPSVLRIRALLQERFVNLHPSKIDFTIHLKPNVCLQKVKTMALNGRPVKSEYFYKGEKMCEIVFEFNVDALNFMTRRREKLGYVNGVGEIDEHFYISDQTYSPLIETQFAEIVSERSRARAAIFDSIKAVCSGYLTPYYMAQGNTYPEVLERMGVFWEAYSNLIDAWVNTGTPALKAQLLIEDRFPLFDVVIPKLYTKLLEDMTVRNYVIARITY